VAHDLAARRTRAVSTTDAAHEDALAEDAAVDEHPAPPREA